MAEEVRLIFKVDKDGAVSVEQLGAKMKKFDAATRASTGSLGELSKSLKASFAVTGINQAIGLFRELTGVVTGFYQEARQGERDLQASTVFDQLNKNADLLRTRLQAASSFEVDTTSLERMANQWRIAGNDIEHLIRVLPTARKLAAGTGEDFLELANKIAEGYIKKSPEAFERFIGKIDVEARAKALGLNEMEKATLRVEEAMRLLQARADQLDLPEARLAQFSASLENIRSNAQKALADSGSFLERQIERAGSTTEDIISQRAELRARKAAEGFDVLRASVEFFQQAIEGANRTTEYWGNTLRNVEKAQGVFLQFFEGADVQGGIDKYVKAQDAAAKQLVSQTEEYIRLAIKRAEIEAIATREQTELDRARLDSIKRQMVALQDVADVANRTNIQVVTNWVNRWSEAIANVRQMTGQDFSNLVASVSKPKPIPPRGGGGRRGPAPTLETDPQSLLLRAQEIQASLLTGQEAIARTVDLAIQRAEMDANSALSELAARVAAIQSARGTVDPAQVQAQEAAILSLAEAQIKAARARADADRKAIQAAREAAALRAVDDAAAIHQGEILALQGLQEEYLLATGQATEFDIARVRLQDTDLAGPFEAEARAISEATIAAREHDAALAALGDGFSGIGGPLSSVNSAMADLVASTSKGSTEIGLASAKMSVAVGQSVSGMLDSLALQYAAQAAGYLGAGIIAVTTGNPQAAGYFAGAAQYGVAAAIAGFSGSTGGGGGKSAAVRSLGTSTPTVQDGGGATYNVYMGNNNVYADDGPRLGEKLIGSINQAKHSGKKFVPQVF